MASNTTLSTLPLELQDIIYEYIFEDRDEQYFPHPLMLTSKAVGSCSTRAAARILGHRSRLQIDCHVNNIHEPERWESSFSRGNYSQDWYHREPDYPRLSPSYLTWQIFRKTEIAAQMLPRIKSLNLQIYRKGNEDTRYNVAFTMHFNNDAPPKIHAFPSWEPTWSVLSDPGLERARAIAHRQERYSPCLQFRLAEEARRTSSEMIELGIPPFDDEVSVAECEPPNEDDLEIDLDDWDDLWRKTQERLGIV